MKITRIVSSFSTSKKDAVDLQKCIPIAVNENNNDPLIFFTSKRDAVDLQKCLPIAVKENNNDQLIFFTSKRDAVRGVQYFIRIFLLPKIKLY